MLLMDSVKDTFHTLLGNGDLSRRDILLFALGTSSPFLLRAVLKAITTWIWRRNSNAQTGNASHMYDLKHGVLNIDTRITPMWMNMGYWKDQPEPRDFPHACSSLLHKILITAGLTSDGEILASDSSNTKTEDSINVIDIGFGCGDQAVALQEFVNLGSYIGITVDSRQFAYAQQRLSEQKFLSKPDKELEPTKNRQIFNADAARPATWHAELKRAIDQFSISANTVVEDRKNWVLGMDVLYHLSPSRLPLFQYAHNNLHASIMAFDLLLPEPHQQHLTVLQSILLYAISLLTSTPFTNFLTPAQYRAQLLAAGYHEDAIEIHDVSADVFAPLVAYMEWQDRQLKAYGLGIGSFHVARWLFGWWARSGLVRGCIVISRKTKNIAI